MEALHGVRMKVSYQKKTWLSYSEEECAGWQAISPRTFQSSWPVLNIEIAQYLCYFIFFMSSINLGVTLWWFYISVADCERWSWSVQFYLNSCQSISKRLNITDYTNQFPVIFNNTLLQRLVSLHSGFPVRWLHHWVLRHLPLYNWAVVAHQKTQLV